MSESSELGEGSSMKKQGLDTSLLKSKLETCLKRHGYYRDDRPDHREWMKYFDEFSVKVRLDQNNPEGFNGFNLQLSIYLRHGIKEKQISRILSCFGKWYETG